MVWLQCCPSRGQQVSHQRCICGIHCKQTSNPPWLWDPRETSPEVHNKESVVPQKRIPNVKIVKNPSLVVLHARFFRTVCMRTIRWSCEGLTSVHNEYTGYTLKHLLLRHMYNLSLPKLCATLLVGSLLRAPVLECDWLANWLRLTLFSLYCTVPYIAACVDVSRTVFRDRSSIAHSQCTDQGCTE